MSWRTLPRAARYAVAGLTSAVLLTAIGATAWRVLGPAEVDSVATGPYPARVVPAPGPLGVMTSAPLILDNRLRIFADKRRVWSDAPPDFKFMQAPFWSLRRWPAQVVGVLAIEGPQPTVVTAWSDGMLIGIDARTGSTIWHTAGEPTATAYDGRRTGASVVYQPAGLFTSTDGTGQARVVVVGPTTTRGYDSASGTELWARPTPARQGCGGTAFTASDQFLQLDTCAGVLRRIDTRTGATLTDEGSTRAGTVEPISCTVGHSGCRAARITSDGTVQGLLFDGTRTVDAPPLAQPGSVLAGTALASTVLAGTVAVSAPDPASATELTGRDALTGQDLWTWRQSSDGGERQPVRLIATGVDRVFLLTPGRTLIVVSASSGRELSRAHIQLSYEPEKPYELGYVYVHDRFLAIERLNPDGSPDQPDDQYYLSHRPVLLTGS